MALRTGLPFTALGEGATLIIEKEIQTEILAADAPVAEEAKNTINENLVLQLRNDLGYFGVEPEWVELRTTLNRYMIRMGKDFLHFPAVLDCLRALTNKGCTKSLIVFLELADQIKMDARNMEFFMAKLLDLNLADAVKSPLAVLMTLNNIEPANWQETVWYLELIIEVDLTMAELTAIYVEQFKEKPTIYTYFLLQIAKTGRLEALDKFVELLPVLEKQGGDIGQEVKPILDFIFEGKLAEAELTIVALGQIYGVNGSVDGWKASVE